MVVHKGHSFRSTNGVATGNPLTSGQDPQIRENYAATADHVWTMNSTTILNLRAAWDRFIEANQQWSKGSYDGTALGFAGPVGSNPKVRMPLISFTEYQQFGNTVTNYLPREPYTIVADLSKTASSHLVRFGTRAGQVRYSRFGPGNWDGTFSFTRDFTSRNPIQTDSTSGNSMASFQPGFPASGSTDVNSTSTCGVGRPRPRPPAGRLAAGSAGAGPRSGRRGRKGWPRWAAAARG